MILMKLTWPLLRMLLRYIRRQIVNRILDYCRRAGWPEKEIHSVRWAFIILFRILLRLLRARLIKRDTAAIFRPDNASC
ncbi:hypothetical protein D9B78_16345 [Serratia marcescens]|uniref:Uncharacterized protein n=1 Tax=Serratia liquefaciens TaxID=614 RepID=A0A515D259_SERLI|nr:hypothetical protein EGO53_23180 [Serratia liquefaciens]RTF45445.1 hypothetical protein D9B78_16745 [Serratia marcescens]RTF45671.1 hypothetical protein D9B78_16345 [Serratia marcescens]